MGVMLAALVAVATTVAPSAARPTPQQCAAITPATQRPAVGHADPSGDLRVVGIQYLQRVANVTSAATFATAIRCLMETYVVPVEVPGRPTLVVFNEDIGLMTGFSGSQGATARAVLSSPAAAPLGGNPPAPAGALEALGLVNAAYAQQIAAYQARLGPIDPRKQVFVGATDTFVRAFVETFSDVARDYGVYVVADNSMAPYRESTDPTDVALFRSPDVSSGPAFVATSQTVTNSAFLWGPSDVHTDGPAGEKNLLFRNDKVPLTDFEATDLGLDNGPTSGAAAIANAAGFVVAGHRLGFATSLPAFAYGDAFGAASGGDPCANVAVTYMRCMDAQGVDTVIQAEANDGPWAATAASGAWQPLEWMQSSWRAVADPSVHFRYAVNPFMVGNLADIPFDGQSGIFARTGGSTFHYIGTTSLQGTDPATDTVYAGDQGHALAVAPWVVPDTDRTSLAAESARLEPGSGDAQEDGYVQTAVWADLDPAPRAPAVVTREPRTAAHRPATPLVPAGSLAATGGGPLTSVAGLVILGVALALRRRQAFAFRPLPPSQRSSACRPRNRSSGSSGDSRRSGRQQALDELGELRSVAALDHVVDQRGVGVDR